MKPELDACWLEGIRAFENGVPRTDNPYSSGQRTTDKAVNWFGGWDMAQIIIDFKPNQAA